MYLLINVISMKIRIKINNMKDKSHINNPLLILNLIIRKNRLK